MKIIAVYNIKGGVGKTATAVNLAYLASLYGANTLLWDLDPQGAASFYYRIKPKVKGGGRKLVEGKTDIDDVVKGTDYENLDLLPADFSYRNMDVFLQQENQPFDRLSSMLEPFAEEYDFIFLDCPPSISAASESVFAAADILLVPTIPTTLSLRTYKQLKQFLKKEKKYSAKVLPFFIMVDARKKLHRLIVKHPPSFMSSLLQSYIPYASEVERMGTHRAPVATYASNCKAARRYHSLWEELRQHLL